MRAVRSHALMLVSFLAACGGAPSEPAAEPATPAPTDDKPAAAEPTAAAKEAAPAEEAKSTKVPDACEGDASSCTMPVGFVKRLCSGVYPDLALMFFAKGTPWRRAWVAVKEAAPFNGRGGPSSDQKLVFEEEVLILTEKKADTGGMQVSGAGASFDTIRWDGTCATLSAEEVRFTAPSKPKHALVPWRSLADETQNALMKDEVVSKTATDRRKECKGATTGTVTAQCEKLDKKLNEVVVAAVRGGLAVPLPPKVP